MAFAIPLTTVFSPAPECLSQIHQNTGGQYVLGSGTGCLPSGPEPTQNSFYSPGLYCPQEYTVARRFIVARGDGVNNVIETRAICCPRPDHIPLYSHLAFGYNSNDPTFGCSLSAANTSSSGALTITVTSNSQTTTSVIDSIGGGINAYSVGLAWQSSDNPLSSLSSVSSTGTFTSTFTDAAPTSTQLAPTPSNTAPATSSATSASTQSGLSTASKATIGVCVPIAIIAILLCVFFALRARRLRAQARTEMSQSNRLDGGEMYRTRSTRETHARPMSELDARRQNNTTPSPPPVELREPSSVRM